MSVILITGASGGIGAALCARLSRDGHEVYRQSRRERPPDSSGEWITFNLSESRSALERLPILDVVFHLAAQTSVAAAREDPPGSLRDNVGGFIELLEALRAQSGQPLVVMAGTVTEVGLPPQVTIDEDLCDVPVTFYDITKLSAELFLNQYVREGWIQGCCLRLATVYGGVGDAQPQDRGVIDKVMRTALAGEPIQVYGEGNHIRDYIHILDVVDAFVAASENASEVNGKTFVIGTGEGLAIKDAFGCAVNIAASITGRTVPLRHVDPPETLSPIDDRSAIIESEAFRQATGWTPKYDLMSGLRKSYGK